MKFHWLTSAALVAGALVTSSPSVAQVARPWVDPPLENGTSPSGPSQSATSNAAEPQPTTSAAPPAAAKIEQETAKPDVQQTAEPVEKPVAKPVSKKDVAERKARRPTREVGVSARSSQQRALAASSYGSARQQMRLTREERVRQGIDSGLELMTLRTIEYPDGRRVQILTRPSPGTMSELLETRR
jgi:hypothetical protein